jgi:hypothetical protein
MTKLPDLRTDRALGYEAFAGILIHRKNSIQQKTEYLRRMPLGGKQPCDNGKEQSRTASLVKDRRHVEIGPRRAFRLLAQGTRSAMLCHLAMYAQKLLRTIRVLSEAKNICIANLAIRFDQLTTEPI